MPESLERYLDQQLDSLKQQGLLRVFRVLEGPQAARARIDSQNVINLSSNNYLGLANHPQLKLRSCPNMARNLQLVVYIDRQFW